MGRYAGKQIVKKLLKNGVQTLGAKALVLGVTFKENVSDIRNSKVFEIVAELEEFGIDVTLTDPFANPAQVEKESGYQLSENPLDNKSPEKFDTIVLAVSHANYLKYPESQFKTVMSSNGLFADIKGVYREKITKLSYWSF